MAASPTPTSDPIKVGLIADRTGALSFVGLANANVARMVVDDLNADGGLLGRRLELHAEDSATDETSDENFLNMVPGAHVEGLYGCLDY